MRAVLGLFNAVALIYFKRCLERAYGRGVARWYALFQMSQFHVIYYASRTLPNSFAFGLTTIAFGKFLPSPGVTPHGVKRRQQAGISLFVLAGIVFRAEVSLLLVTQLGVLLLDKGIEVRTIITTGLISAAIALAISVPLDSWFWQRPLWSELSSFIFNVVHGQSSEWGTSPWYTYLAIMMPKLLLNPLVWVFNVFANFFPPLRGAYTRINLAAWLYVAIYSLQPHKEARFIIYAVPPMTAAAALTANWIWTRRSKTVLYRLGSLITLASVGLSFVAALSMLIISSLNYPGGEALFALNEHLSRSNITGPVRVHLDVLSCMTGVSRFQQENPTPPPWDGFMTAFANSADFPGPYDLEASQAEVYYSKAEDEELLLDPEFWAGFDYALAAEPGRVIGNWDASPPIFGYGGMEFLRSGQDLLANYDQEIFDALADLVGKWEGNAGDPRYDPPCKGEYEEGVVQAGCYRQHPLLSKIGMYGIVREATRRFVTHGWWIGPRWEPKIYVLERRSPAQGYVEPVPDME